MKQLSALLLLCCLLVVGSPQAKSQCTGASGYTAAATGWSPASYPPIRSSPVWLQQYPPTGASGPISPTCTSAGYTQSCIDCPASWSTTLAGTVNRVIIWMCKGNQYTISTCGSPTASSIITIVNGSNALQEWDANSCGTHATVNFSPQISQAYRININLSLIHISEPTRPY